MKYNYSNYWLNEFESRKNSRYYEKLYDKIKYKLLPAKNKNILDVGGGNGQMLSYLGIKKATIFDISDSGLNFAKKNLNLT